jgi:2-polyprenyl-3-methyl-5-hydroxy-6-metoxy-1,4-benzoquinol methylase
MIVVGTYREADSGCSQDRSADEQGTLWGPSRRRNAGRDGQGKAKDEIVSPTTNRVKAPVASPAGPKGHFLQPKWGDGPWGEGSLRDRFEVVRPFIVGGSVLDIGCASRYGRPDWLHGLIAQHVTELVGIDINADTVKKLKAEGYDVELGDARDFDLGRKFDVVFAGELIEHLDDVRGFLGSVKRHLKTGGRLVLTTPNAFYVGNFVYRLGGHGSVHPEHTCWYCEDTLRQVLAVNGFADADITFTGHTSPTTSRKIASFSVQHTLPPRLAYDTIIVVARPD